MNEETRPSLGWPLPGKAASRAVPVDLLVRAAWWIVLAADAPLDLPSLARWAPVARTSESRLRDGLGRLTGDPSAVRDFMRLFRALSKGAGRVDLVEGYLAFGDSRTTEGLFARGGLSRGHTRETVSFDEFVARQTFLRPPSPDDTEHPLVSALRSLIAQE
jgi:hypothetical protein